jgi:hypothetical protein
MLKEEKTNKYVLGVNVPIIKFDLGKTGFIMDWANKVMIDENINETLILIKHDVTHNNLENIEIGQIINMSFEYVSTSRDDDKMFKTNKIYKQMYLVDKYHTDIYFTSDMVKIFSDVSNPKNLERIIKREEQEQLRNTIYKLKPSNNNTYNVSCEIKDIGIDAEKFINKFVETAEKRSESR